MNEVSGAILILRRMVNNDGASFYSSAVEYTTIYTNKIMLSGLIKSKPTETPRCVSNSTSWYAGDRRMSHALKLLSSLNLQFSGALQKWM